MLNRLKTLLGTDASQDSLLQAILDETADRLSVRFLSGSAVPVALEYVVVAVSVIRYNRIASEGMTSQSVEGASNTFIDDDFNPYMDDINRFIYANDIDSNRGRVRFL